MKRTRQIDWIVATLMTAWEILDVDHPVEDFEEAFHRFTTIVVTLFHRMDTEDIDLGNALFCAGVVFHEDELERLRQGVIECLAAVDNPDGDTEDVDED